MTWKSIASRGGKVITDLAIRVHESVTEQDVFAALGQMCAQTGSAIALAGYVVALNGKTVRRATPPDPMFDGADADQLAAWLVDGRSPDLIFPGPAFGASRQFHRLTKDHRVLGGLILAGVEADTATLRACRLLSQLAASAIAGLQKRRLSHMVLEALQQSEEAISFYDEHEGVIFTNEAYHRIFPHYPPPAELVGMSHLDLYRLDLEAGIIDDPVARRDPEVYLAERAQRSRLLVQRQREIQKLASKTYIYTRTRSQTGATMSRRIDITEQAATEARLVERERELHTLAFQDPLTGLYNRAYLKDRLAFLQARLADRTLDGIAVFLFDLNGFKLINDTYGHECGDQVLKTIAARLSRSLSAGNTVVRLGGDEFIILFERDLQEDELAGIAEEAIAAVSEPVHHGELSLRVGTSIGIALASGPGCDAGSIIGDADIAMYEAKRQKFNAFRFFHPSMRAAMVGRLGMADDLREALKNDQFELHYQPQFVTETGALVGFEALVRWRHPTRGLVPPSDFIPIMEDYGLIEALGDWVLATACAEACAWPSQLRLAVNVSPLQVRSGRFSLKLCKTLLASGLPPHRLELEITESVFLNDEARTRVELDDWKVLGVRIALDDFGRGYSSLSYLTALPIDKIKIDRKFVAECDPDQPDGPAAVILRALIDLSRALKIGVTAEGVERPDQLAFLRRHGCGEVQGYLLGRPMPVDAVRRFLTAQDLAVPAA